MFLKHLPSGDLVEILNQDALYDPTRASVSACFHAGEELQDPAMFKKAELSFPSGEPLPRCWVDLHYRDRALGVRVGA